MLCWQNEFEHQEAVPASCTASGPGIRKVCRLRGRGRMVRNADDVAVNDCRFTSKYV